MGGGGNVLLHSQVGEELGDLFDTQLSRMHLLVEKDIALNPVDIRLFSADREVFESGNLTALVE